MKNRLAEMFGIEFPIFAFSHCRDVVAAVTNAGGFGVLGASAYTPAELDAQLTWIDEQTEGRPYGVDLLVPEKFAAGDPANLVASLRAQIPDGHLAFVSDRTGSRQLWVIDLDTGRVRQLTRLGEARLPSWSPRIGSP